MPTNPEPNRPQGDIFSMIIAFVFGFVLFTLLGKLIRRPILLTIVVASLFGAYQYGQHLLKEDLQHVSIRAMSGARQCKDPGSVPVEITNNDKRAITEFSFMVRAFQRNHSEDISNAYYSSDQIIPAGTKHAECWILVDIHRLTDQEFQDLRWTTEITRIRFAE